VILGVPTLRSVVTALRRYHGKPSAPISRDPFHLILWEQVAYLVPDAQRRRAFSALRAAVGLTPPAILRATSAKLARITRLGGSIAADARASRLRESAELVLGRWDGDLRAALRVPLPQARRALAQFPMIGEPGADKILVIMKRGAQITIRATEDQLGGLAESRGASTGGDGTSQPGDSRQLSACGPHNGRRCETDSRSQRRVGSAALGVGHEIPDLLPQDQVKGIPADRR